MAGVEKSRVFNREASSIFCSCLLLPVLRLKPRTHEQIKYLKFEQVLDVYEVNLSGFAQINGILFAHVYKALGLGGEANMVPVFLV